MFAGSAILDAPGSVSIREKSFCKEDESHRGGPVHVIHGEALPGGVSGGSPDFGVPSVGAVFLLLCPGGSLWSSLAWSQAAGPRARSPAPWTRSRLSRDG